MSWAGACPTRSKGHVGQRPHCGGGVEDFADEAGLEAVQEFAESLAGFQVTLLGVQAEEVVEDDLLWPVS